MTVLSTIYNEDCLDTMGRMPDNLIDLTVTSPPYDDARTYHGYKFLFDLIAKNLYRVTAPGGVLVWVVGDETKEGSETGTSFRQALYFMEIGFNLHDTMVYKKKNFSNPSKNRYHQVWEFMFVFSKGTPKTFNPIKDRKNIYAGSTAWGKNTVRQKDGSQKLRAKKVYAEFGMRHNVWEFNTAYGQAGNKSKYFHPATFPDQLALDHIESWSNEGDIVYDPMAGSMTVPIAAIKKNRQWLASEVSEEYCRQGQARIDALLSTNRPTVSPGGSIEKQGYRP